jgi:hypothetical protein
MWIILCTITKRKRPFLAKVIHNVKICKKYRVNTTRFIHVLFFPDTGGTPLDKEAVFICFLPADLLHWRVPVLQGPHDRRALVNTRHRSRQISCFLLLAAKNLYFGHEFSCRHSFAPYSLPLSTINLENSYFPIHYLF